MNNPAARLLDILRAAKRVDANQKSADVWRTVLEVSPDDNPLLLKRLGNVMELPSVITAQIHAQSQIGHEVALRWVPKVNNAFLSLNLDGHFHGFHSTIDDMVLHGIDVCSDILARTSPDPEIKEDSLVDLGKDISALINDVHKASIDPDLRRYVLEELIEIEKALQEYHLFGIKPLKRSLGGALVSITPKLKKEIETTPIGKQFCSVIKKGILLIGFVHGTLELEQDISHILRHVPLNPTSEESPPDAPKNFVEEV